MQRFAVVYLTVILCSSPFASANTDEEIKVQHAFQAYRTALLNQNGEAAWAAVDFHTKKYYEEIAKDCVSLKREDLDRLDLLTRFMVLRMRHEFREERLKKFKGAALFIESVKRGWISKSTVQGIHRMDKITIDRNHAQGYISVDLSTPMLHFIREEEGWKVALFKIFELGNRSFRQMVEKSGMSEYDFIKAMLEQVSKYRVDDRIFDGLLK